MFKDGKYKVRAGKYMHEIELHDKEKFTVVKFNYNKFLLDEIKAMEGARWNPAEKIWTILNTPRNHFAMRYLMGENVYERFDRPLEKVSVNRKLFEHQHETVCFGVTKRHCIWAEEMGLGKTLAMIELMERYPEYLWWYVGTRSSIKSIELEREKWSPKVWPKVVVTYDSLRRLIENWNSNDRTPQGIIFDESSRIKNPMAKRSQMAKHLSTAIHQEYGEDSIIICMTGTPAPKEPVDWWHQAEICQPGYLREGNQIKLKKRLALIVEKESALTGGVYPHLVTWYDDEKKCKKCGKYKDAPEHGKDAELFGLQSCAYEPSKNEVEGLYRRLKGLVLIKFKRDCLDLPEKRYEIIRLKPDESTLRAAGLITNTAKRNIDALIRLRELSDGFQYIDKVQGMKKCPLCQGSGEGTYYDLPKMDIDEEELAIQMNYYPEQTEESVKEAVILSKLLMCSIDEIWGAVEDSKIKASEKGLLVKYNGACDRCNKTGRVEDIVRIAQWVPTPKEGALEDLLENHEECGRIVIYAGFTGSIDRVVKICKDKGWNTIRFDGRGEQVDFELNNKSFLQHFQRIGVDEIEKIAFIGHPMSGGMGLTLTASPSIVYWSNDFNGESRMQSEDRIHRPGMDLNKGATIYDLVHLPSDELVLENLKKKKKLQAITLGEVSGNINKALSEKGALSESR